MVRLARGKTVLYYDIDKKSYDTGPKVTTKNLGLQYLELSNESQGYFLFSGYWPFYQSLLCNHHTRGCPGPRLFHLHPGGQQGWKETSPGVSVI